MKKPVTIVLDDHIIKSIRNIQAKRQRTSLNSVSFSNVISDILEKNLKKV